ncbi:amidohydrolase [Peribacillus psychrosaccharolyticus]|uniref:Amidohydrolase n=1 Tax=Peribacillus psychrosaccharolyticus TaxID=1407 RepID=A0A974NMI1_PERPY|nr:amidohydrolase [Peribacillus psychrosaccharolyticus]MEC2056143.1 amidohydrolase [Peribacillus psychrosaccharolyticus]MED3745583.1 amidohydrolase [Peribacillus psychrosaccharolyticus]QQT00666.1 amidohydrolase [Peribacillus psychrosaccharolyticus]
MQELKIDFNKELFYSFEEIVTWRRYLHMNPEISFQEVETPRFIAEKLRSFGIDVRENIGGNGVVGVIKGDSPGKTIAFRADFDALPIQDEKEVPYKSTVNGAMHACGHDGHTSALLGVAKVLSRKRHDLCGTLILIFQPAEEKPPGGAKAMIDDGVLDGVDYIFGGHLATDVPIGKVAIRSGASMASVDAFKITIQGKGGHGAKPHSTVDAVAIGSELVSHLQQIVSRRVDPMEPAVVTIGSFHAGNAFNIIADTAVLEGTVRALNSDVRTQIEEEIRRILDGFQTADGITYTLDYLNGYPVLENHREETQLIEQLVKENLSPEALALKKVVLGAEDFAYYLQHRPGAFFHVGARNENPATQFAHHHPRFDFDEQAMLVQGQVFLLLTAHYLL